MLIYRLNNSPLLSDFLSWKWWLFTIDFDLTTNYWTRLFSTFSVCSDEGRPPSTASEKPDIPAPSPQSERRSWSTSPSHSRTHRKQHPDHYRRTSTASGKSHTLYTSWYSRWRSSNGIIGLTRKQVWDCLAVAEPQACFEGRQCCRTFATVELELGFFMLFFRVKLFESFHPVMNKLIRALW